MLPNAQFPADLVTFTEDILNEKLNFRVVLNEEFFIMQIRKYSVCQYI